MIPRTLFLALLLLTASARADAPCADGSCGLQPAAPLPTAPLPAVARLLNRRGLVQCYGSGTLVDIGAERPIVLTVAHLFRGGVGEVWVQFPGRTSQRAELLSIDRTWDLAALKVEPPLGVTPVPIATEYPKPGDVLQSCGYGQDGRFACIQGRVRGYAALRGASAHETLQWTGAAREGDSGGPALNEQGQLVAVLWGTDGTSVSGTYCGRIRKFLGNLVPDISTRQESPRELPEKPGSSPPYGSDPPATGGPLEELLRRLNGLDDALRALRRDRQDAASATDQRLEALEQAMALANGTAERLDPSGEHVERLRKAATAAAASKGLSAGLTAVLPTLFSALGWSVPPVLVALVVVGLMVVRRRRSRRSRRTEDEAKTGSPTHDEANREPPSGSDADPDSSAEEKQDAV